MKRKCDACSNAFKQSKRSHTLNTEAATQTQLNELTLSYVV